MQAAKMTNNAAANNPKDVWKNQDTHARPMSAEEIRTIAKKLRWKSRFRRTVFSAAFILYFVLSIGVRIASNERHVDVVGWIGLVRFVLLITWVLGLRYYVADRPMSLNLNAKQVPGLEFYRRELLMQLGYFQD